MFDADITEKKDLREKKKISEFRWQQISCVFIPEVSLEERKEKEEIKKLQQKERTKFEYHGCGKKYILRIHILVLESIY